MRRFLTVLAAAGLFVSGLAVAAIAQGNDTTYTACLTENHKLVEVAEESFPANPCKEKETQISWSAAGPQGEQGEQGIQGVPGDSDILGFYRVRTLAGPPLSTGLQWADAKCEPGDMVTGGGFDQLSVGDSQQFRVFESRPVHVIWAGGAEEAWGWHVSGLNNALETSVFSAVAVCADMTP